MNGRLQPAADTYLKEKQLKRRQNTGGLTSRWPVATMFHQDVTGWHLTISDLYRPLGWLQRLHIAAMGLLWRGSLCTSSLPSANDSLHPSAPREPPGFSTCWNKKGWSAGILRRLKVAQGTGPRGTPSSSSGSNSAAWNVRRELFFAEKVMFHLKVSPQWLRAFAPFLPDQTKSPHWHPTWFRCGPPPSLHHSILFQDTLKMWQHCLQNPGGVIVHPQNCVAKLHSSFLSCLRVRMKLWHHGNPKEILRALH